VRLVAKIYPGATLIPHFREFLPAWVARQPWYLGGGMPSLSPVGYFRFEDPAGEVGIETHLVSSEGVLYQIPMTYRGAPLPEAELIITAEHSVLGPRWIYDGVTDPLWRNELLRLIETGGVSDPSQKRGVGPAEARGHRLAPGPLTSAAIDLRRVLTAEQPEPGILGLVIGTWHPNGPDSTPATGCLAVAR
jgi:hypothetical protein